MTDSSNADTSNRWEQKTIENLLSANLIEQRRKRRWGIFFKLLTFTYLGILLWIIWPSDVTLSTAYGDKTKKHSALVDIRGDIMDNQSASADNITESLGNAFASPNSQAVLLRINSPGGSPVQANYIYSEIMRLRHKYPNKKIYAVCSDVCASAAYYVAASADYIYADPASMVGSIGVLINGFGFVDTMNKIGAQRRLLTAGKHKGFLDPFSPMSEEDAKLAQQMLEDAHQLFIRSVKQGRGQRINPQRDIDLFSGLVWTGNQALALGLIDGFGSAGSVAREIIKNSNIVDYTVKPNLFDQITNRMSTSFTRQIASYFGIKPAGTFY